MSSKITNINSENSLNNHNETFCSFWTITAQKIADFFSSTEGVCTLFSITAGIGIGILWGVSFGLLAGGAGMLVSLAIGLCRSEKPVPPYNANAAYSSIESFLVHLGNNTNDTTTILVIDNDGDLGKTHNFVTKEMREMLKEHNISEKKVQIGYISFNELKVKEANYSGQLVLMPLFIASTSSPAKFWESCYHPQVAEMYEYFKQQNLPNNLHFLYSYPPNERRTDPENCAKWITQKAQQDETELPKPLMFLNN